MGAWRRSHSDESVESNAPGCCQRPCSLACRFFCAGLVAVCALFGLTFLTAHMDGCGNEHGYLGGLKPNNGGKQEMMITLANRFGLIRNFVAPVADVVPWYRPVEFSAAPAQGGKPRVALTIDDSLIRTWPNELDGFEAILGVLDALEVKATFFVIGNHATLSPRGIALLRQASESGHEIGNHGTADNAHDVLTEDQFRGLVELWEDRVIPALGGRWPAKEGDEKWFRPPKGKMSKVMQKVLEEKGYSISLPDVFSADDTIQDPTFHARVLANAPCDGSVLMVHAPDPQSWGSQSVEVLTEVVPVLKERGFELQSLSEVFRESADVKMERKAVGYLMLALIPLSLLSCGCAGCCCCRAICCGYCSSCRRRKDERETLVVGSPRRRDPRDGSFEDDGRDYDNRRDDDSYDDRRNVSPRHSEEGHRGSPRHHDDGYRGSPRHNDDGCRGSPRHHDDGYRGSPRHHDDGYRGSPRHHDDGYRGSPRHNDDGYRGSPRHHDDGYYSPSARSQRSHFNESYYGSPRSRRF